MGCTKFICSFVKHSTPDRRPERLSVFLNRDVRIPVAPRELRIFIGLHQRHVDLPRLAAADFQLADLPEIHLRSLLGFLFVRRFKGPVAAHKYVARPSGRKSRRPSFTRSPPVDCTSGDSAHAIVLEKVSLWLITPSTRRRQIYRGNKRESDHFSGGRRAVPAHQVERVFIPVKLQACGRSTGL